MSGLVAEQDVKKYDRSIPVFKKGENVEEKLRGNKTICIQGCDASWAWFQALCGKRVLFSANI